MRRRTVALIGTVVLAGLAGCGGGSTSGTAKASPATTSQAVKVKNQPSSGDVSVGPGAALPADFPKADVPMPKNATLASASTFTTSGAKNWMLVMKLKVDATQGASDYQHQLTDSGYTVDSGTNVGALLSFYLATGPKYDVKVAGSGTMASKTDPAGLLVTVTPHVAAQT